MEDIDFTELHNVVIDNLKNEQKDELKSIGQWYFDFLISEENKFSLIVAFYNENFTQLAFNYIREFTFIYNLIKKKECKHFTDTCLFNVFQYRNNENRKIDYFLLNYIAQKNNLILWGNDTLTRLDKFLPVFREEEITEFNDSKTINNSFDLFRRIRETSFINYPQLFNLNEKVLSFNCLMTESDKLISENLFNVERDLDDDIAMNIEEDFENKNFKNRINIEYPYSAKAHPYLLDIGKKRFSLIFRNRFSYTDIDYSDIVLLKNEIIEKPLHYRIPKFDIVNTNHSKELYYLLIKLKDQWRNLELNKFTTPFPKYWFLFVNKTLTKTEWFEQFKKDYPSIADKPIINIIEQIISEIRDLNWVEKIINNTIKFLFPELKSNRKKRLEFVYNNFKNYVSSINPNIKFINGNPSNYYRDALVLDSFNIIDLANRSQSCTGSELKIIVPDFLYYGYQPWIKYHLFNYQFTPLYSGLRKSLDKRYNSNNERVEEQKIELIKEIKSEFIEYRKKYQDEIERKEPEITDVNISDGEDFEFNNDEEIEKSNQGVIDNIQTVIISTIIGEEINIPATEKILLQRDTLIKTSASRLKRGDLFIRNTAINNLYKSDELYDKLVNIPENVINFQNELFNKLNAYNALKAKGISYQHHNYFKSTYVIDPADNNYSFRIPRRKNDWTIICEYLNINKSDKQLAFIAYYGRSSQNRIKEMYKKIISLLIDNDWLGIIDNPKILFEAKNVICDFIDVFKFKSEKEIIEVAETVILTILDGLEFNEVKEMHLRK